MNMTRANARRLAAIGGGVLVVILITLLVPSIRDSVTGEPPKTKACGQDVHFYSLDADGNRFGPAASGEVVELKDELHDRRCADPALTVAHAHVWGIPGFGALQGDAAFTAAYADLVEHPAKWRKVIRAVEALEKESSASVETMRGSYQTLYMLDTQYGPLIRQDSVDRPSFRVLRFFAEGGRVVNFKLDCGFQPVQQEFPGVPPVDEPPPEGPPPTTTPTTAPPSTTTTTVPEGCPPGTVPFDGRCVKPPSDDGEGGNDRPVSQPVDEHPQGPTPGAPTDDPPPADREPNDPNGSNGNDGHPDGEHQDDSHEDDVTDVTSPPVCNPITGQNCTT
jgi:hypothetical protein